MRKNGSCLLTQRMCSKNKLNGSIPAAFGMWQGLSNLTYLNLTNCKYASQGMLRAWAQLAG